MTSKTNFSFRKGWNQLTVEQSRKVRDKIISALNLKYRTSFYYRLNGNCEPTVSEAKAIEKIFKSYGIKDIWGNE